ncbi:MAG: hypothetical protein HZB76_00945 [Chlamydiae bacterium]|nr:hypothetical protein [Chlamydiota bacterium]
MTDLQGPGSGPISPKDKAIYKQEFARSVDLFKESLEEFEKATEVHKKAKFNDVMQKAMQIMNETAPLCLNKSLQEQKAKLEKDYQQLISKDNPQNVAQLNNDIEKIQKKL